MSIIPAYIDSGTGSIILQAIIGGAMGATYLVRSRIGSLFGRSKKGARAEKSHDKSTVDSHIID